MRYIKTIVASEISALKKFFLIIFTFPLWPFRRIDILDIQKRRGSISTPTARAPYFLAAVMRRVLSPAPRS